MITSILVNKKTPAMSQTSTDNKIGILLYNKQLTDYTILVYHDENVDILHPKNFRNDMMKLQRTLDILTKPAIASTPNQFVPKTSSVSSAFDINASLDLKPIEYTHQ